MTDRSRGILCMLVAMAFISVQEAFAKYLGEFLPVSQVVWARYIGHLLLMLVVLWPKYGQVIFRPNRLGMQIVRSMILLVDTALFFYGLTLIGLAEATAIFFSVPALVVVLSYFFLGERVSIATMMAIGLGFIGTIIMLRPTADDQSEAALWGALAVFGAACCTAIYNIITRKLAGTDSLAVTLLYTALIGALVSSLLVPFVWQSPVGYLQWLALISIGLFGAVAHSVIITAHHYTAATHVAPFMYTQIFWALFFSWLIFKQLPDENAFMGGSIVIVSGLYLWYAGHRRQPS